MEYVIPHPFLGALPINNDEEIMEAAQKLFPEETYNVKRGIMAALMHNHSRVTVYGENNTNISFDIAIFK